MSSISRPIRRRRGAVRNGCSAPCRTACRRRLALAGITTVEAANAWLRDTLYTVAQRAVRGEGGARGQRVRRRCRAGSGRDRCACRKSASSATTIASRSGAAGCRYPQSPLRPHFVKATVKVHRYPDGRLAIFHGRRCLGRYACDGTPAVEPAAVAGTLPVSPRPAARVASRTATVKDASRRASAVASPSLTAPARDAMARSRSAPGNGPDSLTRKYPLGTPLLQQTKGQRADTDVLPKPDKLISYRQSCGRCCR